jgi:hypothetical protein
LDRNTTLGDQLGGVPAQLFLHAERRMERTLGMVFVGHRRAEQRKNAVPRRLHDIAIVTIDGIHHQF